MKEENERDRLIPGKGPSSGHTSSASANNTDSSLASIDRSRLLYSKNLILTSVTLNGEGESEGKGGRRLKCEICEDVKSTSRKRK